METAFSTVINFLTKSPGYLVYHLVIGCSLFLTGVLALRKLGRAEQGYRARHVLIGCGILFLSQIVLLSLNTVNIDDIFNIVFLNAFIERLISALTVIWLVWTFLDLDKHFIVTGLNIFLSLGLILVAAVSVILTNLLEEPFIINGRILEFLWQGGSLLIIAMGLSLILIKRAHQWSVGFIMLLFLAMGHIIQISLANPEFLPMGAVRLAQMLCLPWVLVLTQRFDGDEDRTSEVIFEDSTIPENKSPLVDTKPTLMDLLLKISLQESRHEKHKAIIQALSLSIVADICYLVYIPNENDNIQLVAGYDLIREEFLQSAKLEREDLRHVMDAWEENQSLVITQDDPVTRDTTTLSQLIKYHRIGNLLAYPLSSVDETLIGGILFISPYTNKSWGENTIALLDEIKDSLGTVLFSPDPQERMKEELTHKQIDMSALQGEMETLKQTLAEKESLILNKDVSLKQLKAKYQIEKIEAIKTINQLKAKIREHTSQDTLLKNISTKLEHISVEIRQLTNERDQLKTALSRTKARIKDLENQTGQTGPIRLSMENQIISLDSIAANVKLRIASQLQDEGIDMEIINPDGRQMIKTDPELLQSVAIGLAQNAIMASEQGANIQFSQKLSFETGMLIIQVTDFGEGLTQSEQTALFSANHVSIPGIGSIQSIREAIRAIRVLNGKIWLRSKKEAFTTFRVELPVRIID